jgi:cell volume regulation protein A
MGSTLLILVGAIIGLGFLANLFFEKTRVPGTLPLIGAGMLLGPVLRVVPPELVRPLAPAFGAVALTIILFEGGLDLDIRHVLRQAGRSVLLACVSFVVAMVLAYQAIVLGLGVSGQVAWAIAAALACTSAPVVVPVLALAAPRSPMRPLLVVESALSDAFAVMVVLALHAPHGTGVSGAVMAEHLGQSMAIGAGVGLVGAALWLSLLGHLIKRPFFYLMTIGFVFLLMGLVESVHGSGALAVLVFGVALANGHRAVERMHPEFRDAIEKALGGGGATPHQRISESHAGLSFVTRSFFFVYLGIMFQWPGSDVRTWLAILLLFVGLVAGREVAVQLVGWVTRISANDRGLLAAMLPRGLATAVLGALIAEGVVNGPPWETLTTFVVVLTNLWMALRLLKLRPQESE